MDVRAIYDANDYRIGTCNLRERAEARLDLWVLLVSFCEVDSGLGIRNMQKEI